MTTPTTMDNATRRRETVRWAVKIFASLLIYGGIIFLSAGRLTWTGGWIFLGVSALLQLLSGIVLLARQSDLLAERAQVRAGTKSWDRLLAPLVALIGPLAIVVVAGLDTRFAWSTPPGAVWQALSAVLAFGSGVFVLWAMTTNAFFSSTVRIQEERGHSVVNRGPYRIVRHPGYFGSVIFDLLAPLMLGSMWAYLPALLTIALIFVRTALEDRTLHAELPGYAEYSASVRCRLIPGVW